MRSPFGVDHGWIKKYSRAYGTARKVEDKTTRAKLRPLPDTQKITIRQTKKKLKPKKQLELAA